MNITQVIKQVSKQYTMPVKAGEHNWHFTCPLDITRTDGPKTTISKTGDYRSALITRRNYIAFDAVLLLTNDYEKAGNAAYDVELCGYSVIEAVKRNVK